MGGESVMLLRSFVRSFIMLADAETALNRSTHMTAIVAIMQHMVNNIVPVYVSDDVGKGEEL